MRARREGQWGALYFSKQILGAKLKAGRLINDIFLNKQLTYLNIITILILCASVLAVILRITFSCPEIFSGNSESARNLLSSLGQIMANIFAIVFTIPLIAIQIAAGKYSSRIFKFYFNSWIILFMFFFLVLIILPLLILSKVESEIHGLYIDIDLLFTLGVLGLLIPYSLYTKEYLKPKKLIEKLDEQNRNIVSKIKNKKIKTTELKTLEENKAIQYDIAKICIREIDSPTLEISMSSIIALMIEPEVKALVIHEKTNDYFEELSEYAFRSDSTKMLIKALYSVAINGNETKNIQITKEAIYCLYCVGMSSLEYDRRKDTETVCKALISLSNKYLLTNLELVLEAISASNKIASSVRPDEPELKYEFFSASLGGRSSERTILDLVAEDLKNIVFLSLKKGDAATAKNAIEELRDMGAGGLHNKKLNITMKVIDKFYKIIELYLILNIKKEDFKEIVKAVKDAISWITIQEGINEEVIEKAGDVNKKINHLGLNS